RPPPQTRPLRGRRPHRPASRPGPGHRGRDDLRLQADRRAPRLALRLVANQLHIPLARMAAGAAQGPQQPSPRKPPRTRAAEQGGMAAPRPLGWLAAQSGPAWAAGRSRARVTEGKRTRAALPDARAATRHARLPGLVRV